ncbi:MAG: DUF4153 domain-containing protein [Pseudomonadota bacterium]
MTIPSDVENDATRRVTIARLIAGLAQGLALYLAFGVWRAGDPAFGVDEALWRQFVVVARTAAIFGPLAFLFGVGRLPGLRLAAWSLGAIALFALFGWLAPAPLWTGAPPVITVWLFSFIVAFILHEFIQGGADDARRIAAYETYFDNASRHAFQVLLALIFLGAFWVVISLGAWLFDLIGLTAVRKLIFSDEFGWIAGATVFAFAVDRTEAQADLTAGARQIGLSLLALLAVLMTGILSAFLVALPFTGLEPLWDTKRATVLLLNAAATMILLINAAFQKGAPPASRIVRAAVRFSPAPMLGVVALAALGLWLRVDQYGFTPARVLAGAELAIVAFFAIGYAVAAVRPGAWMATVKPVNIAGAALVAALLSLLMTPVLDPARISVASQVARLDSGRVDPDDFDFSFLADPRSRRWGARALDDLAARAGSERDDRIALLAKNPGDARARRLTEQSFNDRRAAVVTVGDAPPDAAFLPLIGHDPIGDCLADADRAAARRKASDDAPRDGRCRAKRLDLDGDGDEDLAVWRAFQGGTFAQWGVVSALVREDDGAWRFAGASRPGLIRAGRAAQEAVNALANDERTARLLAAFEDARAIAPGVDDLVGGGVRLRLAPADDARDAGERRGLVDAPDGLEIPTDMLVDQPADHPLANCGPTCCFARAVDLTGDGVDEVVLVRFDGRARLRALAYQRRDARWAFLGETKRPLGVYNPRGVAEDDRPRLPKDAAARRAFVDALAPTPGLSDVVFGDVQFVLVPHDR